MRVKISKIKIFYDIVFNKIKKLTRLDPEKSRFPKENYVSILTMLSTLNSNITSFTCAISTTLFACTSALILYIPSNFKCYFTAKFLFALTLFICSLYLFIFNILTLVDIKSRLLKKSNNKEFDFEYAAYTYETDITVAYYMFIVIIFFLSVSFLLLISYLFEVY